MDDNLDGKKKCQQFYARIFGYTTYMPTFIYTHNVQFQMSKFTSTNKSIWTYTQRFVSTF